MTTMLIGPGDATDAERDELIARAERADAAYKALKDPSDKAYERYRAVRTTVEIMTEEEGHDPRCASVRAMRDLARRLEAEWIDRNRPFIEALSEALCLHGIVKAVCDAHYAKVMAAVDGQ